MRQVKGPRLITFLYNHNPFYIISAGLVLYAIRTSFFAGGETSVDFWFLAGSIAAYTALLALTGFLIVRFGRVWDDARSIFMVLLLLFLALSTSFDSLCIESPSTAVLMLSSGFLFSVLVTELLLWGLGIRFARRFKVSYYLMLAASFFYPLVMSAHQLYFPTFDVRWLIVGFSIASAIAILSLIPAIRRRAGYVAKNGTPWEWPMFPFSVFVLLVVGLGGRLALLSLSFDPTAGDGSILGSYLYVPIALATLVVLLEIGIVEKLDHVKQLALMLSPFAVLLALNWDTNSGQLQFTNQIASEIGAPTWLTLVSLVAVFGVATRRRVAGAGVFLVGALIGAMVLRRSGDFASDLSELTVWPCLFLALMEIATPDRRQSSSRWLKASIWMSIIGARLGELSLGHQIGVPIGVHVVVLSALLIGFVFNDRFALQLRIAVAGCLPVLTILVWLGSFVDQRLVIVSMPYAIGCSAIAYMIYRRFNDVTYYCAAAASALIALLVVGSNVRPQISEANRQSVWLVVIGLACFAIGVFVSCLKAGLAKRFQRSINRLIIDIHRAFAAVDKQNP